MMFSWNTKITASLAYILSLSTLAYSSYLRTSTTESNALDIAPYTRNRKLTGKAGFCMASHPGRICGDNHGLPSALKETSYKCFEWAYHDCPKVGVNSFMYNPSGGGICYCMTDEINTDGTCNSPWYNPWDEDLHGYSPYIMYGGALSVDYEDTYCQTLDAATTAPTVSPTSSPTPASTVSPTLSPTPAPTVSPTSYPKSAPTVSPTSFPMSAPSVSPTSSPSANPTSEPSNSPSVSLNEEMGYEEEEESEEEKDVKPNNT